MPNSAYVRTNPNFGHVVNSEIKESNLSHFRALNEDLRDIILLLEQGRDSVTEYKRNFIGSLAQQFDRHHYLTQTQVEKLKTQKVPLSSTAQRHVDSRHIGSLKQVMIETLKLEEVIEYKVEPHWQSDDGSRRVYLMVDEFGNEVVYRGFAQAMEDIEIGKTYRIKFKVKTHHNRDGILQTIIERPAVLFETDYVAKERPTLRKDMEVTPRRAKRKIPYRKAI